MTYAAEALLADNLAALADMIRVGADETADFPHTEWASAVGEQLDEAAASVDACASRIRSVGVVATVTTWETDEDVGDGSTLTSGGTRDVT